jgi:glyoxylate reductase
VIVGLGRIGRRYAELVSGLAGRIVYVARSPKPEAERELDAERLELDEALAAADVVSLHAPGGEETRHLIGGRELGLMKPTAILVNTSRGTLVDSEALASALDEGRLAAAGLDVYESEPSVPANLLGAPRCVLLPHIGSATTKARDAMALTVAENVLAAIDGREPPNRVA